MAEKIIITPSSKKVVLIKKSRVVYFPADQYYDYSNQITEWSSEKLNNNLGSSPENVEKDPKIFFRPI